MNAIQLINRTFLLAAAPLVGILCYLMVAQVHIELPQFQRFAKTEFSIENQLQASSQKLDKAKAAQ